MNEQQRADLNQAIIQRFLGLRYMYEQAALEVKQEKARQRAKDWAEWDALDAESQAYLLAWLNRPDEL